MEAAVAAGKFETLKDLVHALKVPPSRWRRAMCQTCASLNGQTLSELETSGTRVLKVVREQFQQVSTALLEYLKKSQSVAR